MGKRVIITLLKGNFDQGFPAQVLNSVTKLYILAYISLALSKNAYPERSRSIQWT
jgi:hypothetical protein